MVNAYFLGPTARTLPNGKLDGAQLRGMGRIDAPTMRNWLGSGRINITMPARIDFFGSVDLLGCKKAIADKGVEMPGNPVTSTFALDMPWKFSIEANDNPNANTFKSIPYDFETTTDHPIPMGTFKNQQAMNWILQYFGLKGVKMTAHAISPTLKGGGMESSNMVTGASSIYGSMLSGADYSLGRLFTLATLHENEVHGGLTGGQGLSAGIMGGAYGFEWIDGYEPFAAIAHELFGPERYQDFKDHVVLFLPGTPKGAKRSSVDINEKWTSDMMTTVEGNTAHRNFVRWSLDVMEGLRDGDWTRVATALQNQTDVRYASCPLFMAGLEDEMGKFVVKDGSGNALRGINRGGAGGLGTISFAVCANKELADEMRALVGQPLEFNDAQVAEMKETGVIPRGEIPFNLTQKGIEIEFEGLPAHHGFNMPGKPEPVEI